MDVPTSSLTTYSLDVMPSVHVVNWLSTVEAIHEFVDYAGM